jgi:hypothetical protein
MCPKLYLTQFYGNSLCDGRGAVGGQRKRKCRTFTGRAFGPDPAMMKIDNAFGDG